jgi:ATP-dependent DNA ligase
MVAKLLSCKLGLEGIVSKRKGSMYRSGRSPDWLKMKNSDAPAVKREAEEDWGKRARASGLRRRKQVQDGGREQRQEHRIQDHERAFRLPRGTQAVARE